MKKVSKAIIVLFILSLTALSSVSAHSGRTDANGGHNCSAKSKEKGLCTGYHYHNGGTTSSSNNKNSSSSNKNTTKPKAPSVAEKSEYTVSKVQLYVNNNKIALKNDVLNKDNANYFPIRDVANAIGASIEVNSDASIITLSKNNNSVAIHTSASEVVKKNNTTYAPIRTIVSKLGVAIEFDTNKNIIYLTDSK